MPFSTGYSGAERKVAMMDYELSRDFQTLLRDVRNGSNQAAEELVAKFGRQILVYVRRKLRGQAIRTKLDSVDFVQSIWGAFFAICDKVEDIETADQLAAYLTGIARNRLASEFRKRFERLKHQVTREIALDHSLESSMVDHSRLGKSGSQLAIARETLHVMLADRPERHQQILTMRICGYDYVEIAAKLDMDEGSVRRIVRKVREEWRDDD